MRACFDLENAQFSQESEEEVQVPVRETLDMYNQQYFLLYNQAKQFFADCKDSISRFMALNSMGFGFNLPLIMSSFIGMENKSTNGTKWGSQQNELRKKQKQRYSKSFYTLLNRMGDLIQDLVNLEVEIKKNYMGFYIERPNSTKIMKKCYRQKQSFGSDSSGSSSELVRKNIKQSIVREQMQNEKEKQQKIRGILKKKITIKQMSPKSVCKMKSSPSQNLQKLSTKIDNITRRITIDKQKQQRVWQNFNKKKPSNQQNQQTEKENSKKTKQKVVSIKILDNILDQELGFQHEDDLEETASIRTKNTIQSIQFQYFQLSSMPH